jgi:hypothetical protein
VFAARWAGYRFFRASSWEDLTTDQQAYLIAAYELEHELAAADAQARAKEIERQSRVNRSRTRG